MRGELASRDLDTSSPKILHEPSRLRIKSIPSPAPEIASRLVALQHIAGDALRSESPLAILAPRPSQAPTFEPSWPDLRLIGGGRRHDFRCKPSVDLPHQ